MTDVNVEADSELLNSRINALSVVVNMIDSDLEAMGESRVTRHKSEEGEMDKISYTSELKKLHGNLISAHKALTDRVRECRLKGMTSDQIHDAFWPNVLLYGNFKPNTVVLKDYGISVDLAFSELMNFLIEKKPVDSKASLRKRNRLLNDKLTALMEKRRCQLQLLPEDDYGTFSLSQWTVYASKEFSEGDPTTGTRTGGIPLLRHNSDLVKGE